MVTAGSPDWSSADDDALEAERFQAVLDGLPTEDGELQDLAALANSLGADSVVADQQFVSDLRNRLVATATSETPQPVATRGRPRRGFNRIAVAAVAAAVLVTTSAGVASAAQTAIPGSALYPVKTGLEDIQVEISQDPKERGRTELDIATIRLTEVRDLLSSKEQRQGLLSTTITAFTNLARSGTRSLLEAFEQSRDRDDILTLRAFVDNALVTLHQLRPQLEANSLGESLEAAINTLVDSSGQAYQSCPDCTPTPSSNGMPVRISDQPSGD